MDVMRAARRGRDGHRLRRAGQQFDPVGLVDGVQHEGAAGLALAVQAMAAVHEHGRRGQPIAHLATGAAAFQGQVHRASLQSSPPLIGPRAPQFEGLLT